MPRVYSEILGTHLDLPDRPERIVSLAPAITETLYLLGVEDRIAGVSHFCNKPPRAKTKPRLGTYYNVNWRKLEEINPDLVLVTTGAQRKTMEELRRRGYPVYPLPLPVSLYGILENIVVVGHLVGETRAGRLLARRTASRLEQLRGQLEGVRVYYEIWLGGPVSAGRFSYIADALAHLGAENCTDSVPEPWLINPDPDLVRDCDPDVVIYELPPYSGKLLAQVEKSLRERGLTRLPTVEQRGVLLLPPDSLAHYGPSIVEALEDIALAVRGKMPRNPLVRWHRLEG